MDLPARVFAKIDSWLFWAFSITCVAWAARAFYGYLLVQTGGEWSAPLDDVFIHFDYARATARGYPFQWSEGNGFSSGNTSLSYPFVLAAGYWVGFRGMDLMRWAAIVAGGSLLVFFGAAARLVRPFGRWAKYLLPPVVLSVGALDWTLFSGMENAFHLCTWALMLAASMSVARAAEKGEGVTGKAWVAGLAGALLYLTRPESVVCVAAFAIWAALVVRARREDRRFAWGVLIAMSAPGAVAFVGQAVANKVFTGEWAAAGAIAKLTINHPYLTPADKWSEYLRFLRHVVLRNTHRHLGEFGTPGHPIPFGWLVPIMALVPLAVREVRGVAALLWVQVIGWLLLVSLNGQVVWQNERYTMAAVAWLLVLAAMGLAALASGAWRKAGEPAPPERRQLVMGALRIAGALIIAGIYWRGQLPRMRDQIWFFGRASRNIRDQHVVAGLLLGRMKAERVLVGDAGALVFASDRPAIDLIGLGGYKDLPFARAGVHGLGSSLELIERLPPEDRPDTMAIYPSWWGDLPLVFGKRLVGVPVFGNVICGGSEKVIYRASWGPLERAARPRLLREGERVVDEVDVADLVNEKQHGYEFPHPAAGFVGFRVLADPEDGARDLFDAGRVIAPGQRETMRLTLGGMGSRLVLRVPPETRAKIDVLVNGDRLGQIALEGAPRPVKNGKRGSGAEAGPGPLPGAWLEVAFDVPVAGMGPVTLSLVAVEGAYLNAHVWAVARVRDGEPPRAGGPP